MGKPLTTKVKSRTVPAHGIESRITFGPHKRKDLSKRIYDLQRKIYLCNWQLRWYPFIPGWYGERDTLLEKLNRELRDLQRLILSCEN